MTIYFLRPVGKRGPVKIGCSQAPIMRLDTMTAWSPVPLEIVVTIPGSLDLERNIHECLADLHSHCEWFRAHKRIDGIIDGLLAGKPIGEVIDLSDRKGTIRKGGWRTKSEADKVHRRYANAFRSLTNFRKSRSFRYVMPDDVRSIMWAWRRDGAGAHGREPTAEQFKRLDEVIAHPDQHMTRQLPWYRDVRAA